MKIETKLNLGDKGFFLMHGKVMCSPIIHIQTSTNEGGTSETYTVRENPSGSAYTTRFNDNDIFASKEELLKSL